MSASRDARQDAALIALLKALPEARLARILAELVPEVTPQRIEAATDPRRCGICGRGYVGCRKADVNGDHEWTPKPASRRAFPTQRPESA